MYFSLLPLTAILESQAFSGCICPSLEGHASKTLYQIIIAIPIVSGN
jgi:hypothetical protein